MPYGKSYRRSTRRPYRRPARRPARQKGPALTVKKRIPLARKSTAMANKRAIRSLSMRMYGSLQCSLVKNVEVLKCDTLHPLLFDLSDATQVTLNPPAQGGRIWQRLFTPAGTVSMVSAFQTPPTVATNPFINRWANDRPGSGKYLLEHSTVCIELEGRPNLTNTRVRIQVFRAKGSALVPNVATAPTDSLILPEAMIHFKHMADVSANPNLLPRKYFTTVYDKWVVISSAPANTPLSPGPGTVSKHPTTLNKKYVRFSIKRKQLVKQSISYPVVQDVSPATPVPELPGGFYGPKNRSISQPLWCLISCDDSEDANHPGTLSVGISKYQRFRDPVGAY